MDSRGAVEELAWPDVKTKVMSSDTLLQFVF